MMAAVSTVTARDGQRTARLFHALADKTRLRILEQLADGEQCVCDLTDALEAGQSRLSFVDELRDVVAAIGAPRGRGLRIARCCG
jgi:ArsR family transcriptional regulator